jgi:hypothetical protein
MIKKVTITEFKEMLSKGTVKFQYTKNDGTLRTAVGTMKSDLITKKPAGGMCHPKNVGYTLYFDVEKDGWRVFAESKLLGVVEG